MLPQRQTTSAPGRRDLDVADVAGAALRAAVQLPAHDDRRRRCRCRSSRRRSCRGRAPSPAVELAERHHVHVVVDPDRHAVSARSARGTGVAVPAGHDRRRDRAARLELDGAWDADADAEELAGQRSTSRPALVEELLDAAEHDPSGPGARCRPARRRGRGSSPARSATATSMLVAPRSATSRCPASAAEAQRARRAAAGRAGRARPRRRVRSRRSAGEALADADRG